MANQTTFPIPLEEYIDQAPTLLGLLWDRILAEPFNLFSLTIFICAILHTFFANKFKKLSHYLKSTPKSAKQQRVTHNKSFLAETCYLLSEIEIIFGLWVIPLLITMSVWHEWSFTKAYVSSLHFNEAVFVGALMVISATKPLVYLFDKCITKLARLISSKIVVEWCAILIIGPLLGSFITEPAAITLSALTLQKRFFSLKVSKKLKYVTLALLFVNTSIGGLLTNFAGHAIVIVAKQWQLSSFDMFVTYGIRAICGVVLSTLLFAFALKKEFKRLGTLKKRGEKRIPFWVILIHIAFLVWMIFNPEYIVIILGSLLLFLGFFQALRPHQSPLNLRQPLLVTFFLGGLLIHVSLQGWWIEPILERLSDTSLMIVASILTAFNDNATVTNMSLFVPGITMDLKYAIISGASIGGGLTIIANAPNIAAQNILSEHFDYKVSPLYLAFAAIIPTLLLLIIFSL